MLFGGGCALLLEVAHPLVAAGVAEHSNFRRDPFGRLQRTLAAISAIGARAARRRARRGARGRARARARARPARRSRRPVRGAARRTTAATPISCSGCGRRWSTPRSPSTRLRGPARRPRARRISPRSARARAAARRAAPTARPAIDFVPRWFDGVRRERHARRRRRPRARSRAPCSRRRASTRGPRPVDHGGAAAAAPAPRLRARVGRRPRSSATATLAAGVRALRASARRRARRRRLGLGAAREASRSVPSLARSSRGNGAMKHEDDEPRGKVDAVSLLYIFGGIPVHRAVSRRAVRARALLQRARVAARCRCTHRQHCARCARVRATGSADLRRILRNFGGLGTRGPRRRYALACGRFAHRWAGPGGARLLLGARCCSRWAAAARRSPIDAPAAQLLRGARARRRVEPQDPRLAAARARGAGGSRARRPRSRRASTRRSAARCAPSTTSSSSSGSAQVARELAHWIQEQSRDHYIPDGAGRSLGDVRGDAPEQRRRLRRPRAARVPLPARARLPRRRGVPRDRRAPARMGSTTWSRSGSRTPNDPWVIDPTGAMTTGHAAHVAGARAGSRSRCSARQRDFTVAPSRVHTAQALSRRATLSSSSSSPSSSSCLRC